MIKVLVVEDKENYLSLIVEGLETFGFEVDGVRTGKEAMLKIRKKRYSCVVSDLFLPDVSGMEVLKEAKKFYSTIPFIIITAFSTVERAVSAIKEGAYDFIAKPFDIEHLAHKIELAVKEEEIVRENIALKEEIKEEIIGENPFFLNALEKLKKVAPTDSTVLLLGESGTGKELFARKLHRESKRKDSPFVSINCSAIPEKLLETELFGYEKGAFTGAYKRKIGKLELAHGGTFFMDEIGELSPELQPKILRVIEEKRFERVGGTESIEVDVRFVFATNKDLKKEVQEGRFREDLYFRISVFPIKIPPLRERKDDIPLLVNYFIKTISQRIGKRIKGIEESAMEYLVSYDWYGNVRELQNTIERAIIVEEGEYIRKESIFLEKEEREYPDLKGKLKDVIRRVEEYKIREALQLFSGDKFKASEYLGISYNSLLEKIKKYGI